MAAGSPSFRESVSEWPRARDGASALGSAWARRFLAALLLPQGSVLAALGSLARHARSAWVPFPASSPESALRRGEESQKLAVYSVRSATVSVLVSPASLVSHLTASENPQALRKVSLQAGLVERTYFLQPLHLAKHLAHLTILPEHFCLAIVSVQVGPMSPVFRPALSENRQAFRKVWLPAGLVERASFLQPLHLAKHPEQHSPSANSRQVSLNWAVFSSQQPPSESRSRRAIQLRQEIW